MGFLSILCCSSDSSSNTNTNINTHNNNSKSNISYKANNNKKDNNLTVKTNYADNNHKQVYNKQHSNNNYIKNTISNNQSTILTSKNKMPQPKNSNINNGDNKLTKSNSKLNKNSNFNNDKIRNNSHFNNKINNHNTTELKDNNINMGNNPNRNNKHNNNTNVDDMDIDDEKDYDIDEYDDEDMDKEYLNFTNDISTATTGSNINNMNNNSKKEKQSINLYSTETDRSTGNSSSDGYNQPIESKQNAPDNTSLDLKSKSIENNNHNLVKTDDNFSKENQKDRTDIMNETNHEDTNNSITYSEYDPSTANNTNNNNNNATVTNINDNSNSANIVNDPNIINHTITNNSVDPLTISNTLTVTTTTDTQSPIYYNNQSDNDNTNNDDYNMMQHFDENEEFIDLTILQQGQYHAVGYNTLLPPKSKQLENKKCLILDLDETLVHSSFKYLKSADFVLPVDIDDQIHNVYVIKRPGVDEFLERVGKLYEVVVFTASVSRYGDPLLDILDKNKTIHHRLFREACYNYEGNYIKNLSQIGRQLSDIIILDNSPASYIFHPQHAIPISSWFSDTHDNELLDIIPILEDLSKNNVLDVGKVLDVSI